MSRRDVEPMPRWLRIIWPFVGVVLALLLCVFIVLLSLALTALVHIRFEG